MEFNQYILSCITSGGLAMPGEHLCLLDNCYILGDYFIPEIEHIILEYLDPIDDYKNLILVNKYYKNLKENDNLFKELKNFHELTKGVNFGFEPWNANENEINFLKSCKYGSDSVTKYLYKKYEIDFRKKLTKESEFLEIAFGLSCFVGKLKTAQWLFDLNLGMKLPFDIHYSDDYLFSEICENGHIDVLKWLLELGNKMQKPYDFHIRQEFFFCKSCEGGHLDVAKWLYELSCEMKHPIDIHINNEMSFGYSCYKGHFELAKWLWNLSIRVNSPIDLHVENECIFRSTCEAKKFEIVKWLNELSIQMNSPILRFESEKAFIEAWHAMV